MTKYLSTLVLLALSCILCGVSSQALKQACQTNCQAEYYMCLNVLDQTNCTN